MRRRRSADVLLAALLAVLSGSAAGLVAALMLARLLDGVAAAIEVRRTGRAGARHETDVADAQAAEPVPLIRGADSRDVAAGDRLVAPLAEGSTSARTASWQCRPGKGL